MYVASAIEADGTSGGATHVSEVACGLRDLGHTVLLVARQERPRGKSRGLECGVRLVGSRPRKELALLAYRRIARVMDSFRPDIVMERFYNFAGAGVAAAHRRDVPVLLEVNAPMVDPPGSAKSRLDRLMLGSMRRWAVRQAEWSEAIVTPLNSTVPPEVSRGKIHALPWGANVERFDPQIRSSRQRDLDALAVRIGLARTGPVAVFLGSFRAWHGAANFAEAARLLLSQGSSMSFLAVGGGPELAPLMDQVRDWGLPPERFVFVGPQPYDLVPDYLALADIGVAPFDLDAHAPLKEFGFYWSPLKVFEYMSMAMPVVTVDILPLNRIVRDGFEGLLYASGDVKGLAHALARLENDQALRLRMGASARDRVVAEYSWKAHCEALDRIMTQIAHAA